MASPSSEECRRKIQAYETAKGNVTGVYGYVEDCQQAVTLSIPHFEQVVISGQSLDDGKMSQFSSNLSTVLGNLQAIASECDEKIALWQAKLAQAIEEEKREAEQSTA